MIAALKVDEQRPSSDFCCEIIGLINRFAQIWARNRQAKRATQIRKRPAHVRPSSTAPAKNAAVQLAHFKRGSCRRLSHAGDGTCCHMFPRSASVRLLRKQLWRLDHSHLNGCLPQSLSESALTILFLFSKGRPCSPWPVALWPSFFAFRVCFCVSNPP